MDQLETKKSIQKEGGIEKEKLSGEPTPPQKNETKNVSELYDPGRYDLED